MQIVAIQIQGSKLRKLNPFCWEGPCDVVPKQLPRRVIWICEKVIRHRINIWLHFSQVFQCLPALRQSSFHPKIGEISRGNCVGDNCWKKAMRNVHYGDAGQARKLLRNRAYKILMIEDPKTKARKDMRECLKVDEAGRQLTLMLTCPQRSTQSWELASRWTLSGSTSTFQCSSNSCRTW